MSIIPSLEDKIFYVILTLFLTFISLGTVGLICLRKRLRRRVHTLDSLADEARERRKMSLAEVQYRISSLPRSRPIRQMSLDKFGVDGSLNRETVPSNGRVPSNHGRVHSNGRRVHSIHGRVHSNRLRIHSLSPSLNINVPRVSVERSSFSTPAQNCRAHMERSRTAVCKVEEV